MLSRIKHLLIGSPLPIQQLEHKRLTKIQALASFSPDALSSIAYANQEIYLGLLVAGSAGLALSLPVGLFIAGLLTLVALSYFQTIEAYPSGGGSYSVARNNLGTLAGLVAASALLIDYMLTAAVSLTAGVEAIASAFPELWPHRVSLSILFLLIITVINLRGVQETGTLMAVPVYLFLASYLFMLAFGIVRVLMEGPGTPPLAAPAATQPLTLFLVLHAFSAGCTALTGIEAISNGVPVFRKPEASNARKTLLVMALLMAALFVGSIGLTQFFSVVAGAQETILSALARRLLGSGLGYLLIQISTMLILVVAANTSFAGFPRLAAILARDSFLPRQLAAPGDRLVFQNGILVLAAGAAVLIVAFGGDTHSLIPLFAVGVFLAFTLSQAGMVHHWWRIRDGRWWLKMLINGIGALATGIVLIVVGVSKFGEGAWITIILVPVLVLWFLRVQTHYLVVAEQLSLSEYSFSRKPFPTPRVVIPISSVHRGVVDAIRFAKSISKNVTGVYIELEPGSGEQVRNKWQRWWPKVPLVILPTPYRSIIGPLLDFLDEEDNKWDDGQLAAVVLPEFVPAHWWESLLHNQTAWLIKTALLYRRRHLGYQRVIIDIPYHLER